MKFIIVKWRTICAKIKSANPRSGLISLNCALFCGFACNLRHTEKKMKIIVYSLKIIQNTNM